MEFTSKPDNLKYIIRCMLVLPKKSKKYIIDELKHTIDVVNINMLKI